MNTMVSVASVASASAVASPLVEAMTPATPAIDDPIFAAIEAHRRAYDEFESRCSELDDEDTEEASAEWDRLSDAVDEGAKELCWVEPTTIGGVITLLRYSADFVKGGRNIFPGWFVEAERDGRKADKFESPFAYFLERHAADSLETIVTRATPGELPIGRIAAEEEIADPIFAAIKKYRTLDRRWGRLYNKLDVAEGDAHKEHGLRPAPLIPWRDYSHIGGGEIDLRRAEFIRDSVADPEQIELEYLDAKKRYRKQLRAGRNWDRRAGLAKQRAEYERTVAAARRAAWDMARTRPTTPQGAAALIKFVVKDQEAGRTDWHSVAFRSAATALQHMPA